MAEKKSLSKAKIKKTAGKKREVNLAKLRALHMMSAGLFVLLAIVAATFMSRETYHLTLGYLTKDILADGTVLAPAMRIVYDIELRWVLIGMLLLSAAAPVLYMTSQAKRYNEAVKGSRVLPWRWLDLAITGVLMTEVVALLSGVQDIMALKLIGGVVALSFALSWAAEKQNNTAANPQWLNFVLGSAAAALPWLLIAVYAVSTVVYGTVWSPWYVYALYAVVLLGFASTFCIQFTDYRRKKAAWKNYMVVERNYIAVNMLTKAAFAIVLVVGLLD